MRKLSIKIILSILFVGYLFGCGSSTSFEKRLEKGECKRAEEEFLKQGKDVSLPSKGKEIIGSVFSYAGTGLGYATDVVLLVGREVGVRVVICAPIGIVEAAAKGSGNALSSCFSGINTSVSKGPTQIGKSVYKKTENWRCADLTPFSKRMRGLSKCYEKSGDTQKSLGLLNQVRKNENLYSCISDKEKDKVIESINRLESSKIQ